MMSKLLIHLYILQFVVKTGFPEDELLLVQAGVQKTREAHRSWGDGVSIN